MFYLSFHHQHQIRRVLIVSTLAMLVALLVTWTTRSHAYELTEFDRQAAVQPYQQREQVREQLQALRKSGAWAAIVRNLKIFDEVGSRLLKYKALLENVSQLLLGGPRPGN